MRSTDEDELFYSWSLSKSGSLLLFNLYSDDSFISALRVQLLRELKGKKKKKKHALDQNKNEHEMKPSSPKHLYDSEKQEQNTAKFNEPTTISLFLF